MCCGCAAATHVIVHYMRHFFGRETSVWVSERLLAQFCGFSQQVDSDPAAVAGVMLDAVMTRTSRHFKGQFPLPGVGSAICPHAEDIGNSAREPSCGNSLLDLF